MGRRGQAAVAEDVPEGPWIAQAREGLLRRDDRVRIAFAQCPLERDRIHGSAAARPPVRGQRLRDGTGELPVDDREAVEDDLWHDGSFLA